MVLKNLFDRLLFAAARRLAGFALSSRIRVPEPAPQASFSAARTEELNAAAERYFAARDDREYQLGKPFSDPFELPQYLFNAGVLLHWLKVGPGDLVAEIGAGACWLSHFLNLYGCRTVAIDVSATALELGKERFSRDPRTRHELEPRFLTYDGFRLPLADASCDRIVLHDAFHHLPNPEELLREMARTLRPGGIVAMSEPGRTHSQSESAHREVESTGVLENDVVVEELAAQALGVGFSRATVVPLSLRTAFEVPAEEFVGFARGRRVLDFWPAFASELVGHHYILLYKGDPLPTTRRPGVLAAELLPLTPLPAALSRGESPRFRLRVTNRGETLWLATHHHQPGWTRLGIHLTGLSAPEATDFNWFRADLPQDLAPGQAVEVELQLPAPAKSGQYRLELDLVAEHITWFAERGSKVLAWEMTVGDG